MNLEIIQNWLHINSSYAQLVGFAGVFIAAILIYLIAKFVILFIIEKLINKTSTKWDDALIEHKVFKKLIILIPFLIIYSATNFYPSVRIFIQRITIALMVWIIVNSVSAFLKAVNTIYSTFEKSKERPIKGYLQIVGIFFFIIGGIIIIAVLLGKSPWILVSGLGAMTAVLLLIFKDTILSLIASLQISFNDLIQIGDWLEVPQYNADGDVIDIALHTIKIQNWDKTISVIPTHKLIDGTFKNWRGMTRSGGRRIKRAINIDISTIRFCDDEMLRKFKKFQLIKNYLEVKEKEIAEYNIKHKVDTAESINRRILTNIGTFRAYISAYLKNHPKVKQDMTFLIRQLPPGPTGLPIEIYVFANDTVWANYEAIQSDIFDHILAVVPEFGLKVFQYPTGFDLRKMDI
jgi:miniconductance mechanosensitive channel